MIAMLFCLLLSLQDARTPIKADPGEQQVFERMAGLIASDPANAAREAIALLPGTQDLATYYALIVSLSEVPKDGLATIVANIRSAGTAMEVRRDLVISIQLNEYAAANVAVLELLADSALPGDIRIAVVEECAKRKIKESVPMLIELLASEEAKAGKNAPAPPKQDKKKVPERAEASRPTDLGRAAKNALLAVTDKSFTSAIGYTDWWKANGAGFVAPAPKAPTGDGALAKLAGTTVVRYEGLKTILKEADVVVVPHDVDRVETVLRKLQIPHLLTDSWKPKVEQLRKARVIVVDCDGQGGWGKSSRFYPEDPKRTEQTLQTLKGLVESGTYLVTTDWGLASVLLPMFQEVVRPVQIPDEISTRAKREKWYVKRFRIWPPKGTSLASLTRDAWIETDLQYGRSETLDREALLLSLHKKKISASWRIDGTDAFVDPGPQTKLDFVAVSQEVGRAWGYEAVGFVYPRGKGKVLHFMAHFNDQMDGQNDKYALQKLLLNFILEAAERSPQ